MSEQQWIEIKNEHGQLYYFNKITGVTTQERPVALRVPDKTSVSSSSYQHVNPFGESLPAGANKEDKLTELFAERNLALPKNVLESQGAYAQPSGVQGFTAMDTNSVYMTNALNQALKSEQVRDIFPSLNYFKTEEKQSDVRRFRSYDNLSKEDSIYVFKEALKDAGVSSTWKWEDANRVIMNDPRVKALKAISERKQTFNDFINELKTKERNDARTRRQQQKEGFVELLKEQKHIHSLSKFYQVAKTLQNDARFKNIEEKDREEIFQDFLDELMNKERDEKRDQSDRTITALKDHFQKIGVPANSKWLQVEKELKDDPIFSSADPMEQITAFEEHIKALERHEFQQKKFEKRRSERKNRENFQKLLEEKMQTRELTQRTKWRHFVKLVKDDPRYYNLVGQPGSTAHELYEDVIKEEKDILKIHKAGFKTLIKSKGIKFENDVEFGKFDQELQKYPEYSQLSKKTQIILYEYYQFKVKQKDQERQKKQAKVIKSLEKYLKSSINLSKSSDYSYYKSQIEKHGDFNSLSEETKQKSFSEIVKYLKDYEESKRSKKKSRSRRRGSSRSSSVESGEVKTSHPKSSHSKRSRSRDKNGRDHGNNGRSETRDNRQPSEKIVGDKKVSQERSQSQRKHY